jgi:hypothetical protein
MVNVPGVAGFGYQAQPHPQATIHQMPADGTEGQQHRDRHLFAVCDTVGEHQQAGAVAGGTLGIRA